tara:strand:- start:2877 stop:3080 length:204 start_codon:yes stop_codon:yes gene_type:complete
MKAKMKGYNMGGFTMGAGDGDITPAKAGMRAMAASGGLMGFMNGGSVLDPMMGQMKMGGQKKSKKTY